MSLLKSFSPGEKRVLAALLVVTVVGAAVSLARRTRPEWFLGTPDVILGTEESPLSPAPQRDSVQSVQAAPTAETPTVQPEAKTGRVLSTANVPIPTKKPAPDPSRPILLNSADAAALESLPGVGPVLAERILEYRRAHGGFRSIEELNEVKGIGKKTFEKIYPFVTLEDASNVSGRR